MIVLAIDPGPENSAWLVWDGEQIRALDIQPNTAILELLNIGLLAPCMCDVLAIEQIKSYGMAVSDSIFDTVFWTGRFIQAWSGKWERVPRMTVKMHLCHSARAKDSNIRQVLVDRFGEPGTKKAPGLTYGLRKDLWAAFALAVTYFDTKGQ